MSLTIKELELADKCVRVKVRELQASVNYLGKMTRLYKNISSWERKLKRMRKELEQLQSLLRSIWNARVEGDQ